MRQLDRLRDTLRLLDALLRRASAAAAAHGGGGGGGGGDFGGANGRVVAGVAGARSIHYERRKLDSGADGEQRAHTSDAHADGVLRRSPLHTLAVSSTPPACTRRCVRL